MAAWPVYYHAPLYRRLAADPRIDFTAVFASNVGVRPVDLGYGRDILYDQDPVAGYRSVFLKKAASNPHGGGTWSLRDWDVVGEIYRRHFDVLWVHGYNLVTHAMAIMAQRFLRRGGVVIRENQTVLNPRARWKEALKRTGLPVLFHNATGAYVGTANYRWFSRYGFSPERLFLTPYAVDNERFQTAAARLMSHKQELRRSFGIHDAQKPVLLTVSRLIAGKQLLAVLDAFRVARSRTPCTLLVVGTGPMESELRQVVDRQNIPDVVFAGFLNQSDVGRAYAAADFFTLFSQAETWGLVVNEAMNFYLPILVSDKVACGYDLVKSDQNGYQIPADQPGLLADRIEELARSPAKRERYGAASASLIRTWSHDAAAEGIVAAAMDAFRHARSRDTGS